MISLIIGLIVGFLGLLGICMIIAAPVYIATHRTCPYCRTRDVPKSATVCPECGSKLKKKEVNVVKIYIIYVIIGGLIYFIFIL